MTIAHLWIGDGGWGLFEAVFTAGFVAITVLALVALLRAGGHGSSGAGAPTSGLRLLEERYARGEIDREEFLARREVLTRGPGDEG